MTCREFGRLLLPFEAQPDPMIVVVQQNQREDMQLVQFSSSKRDSGEPGLRFHLREDGS